MIKHIIDPISEGDSYEALIQNIDKDKFCKLMDLYLPLKFKVESIGRKIKPHERDQIINMYGCFGYDDKIIDLKDPKQIYCVVSNEPSNEYYFGVEVACMYGKTGKLSYFSKYDLKSRPYLGPTSTSHELAFLMANQAEIKEGDIVLDPFAGTGSILIACSALKGLCFGSDIDLRVLQGYSVGRKNEKEIEGTDVIQRYDIFANFKYYNLPKPCIAAMDLAYPLFKNNTFDAIVCDPPYGIKAGSKKTKAIKDRKKRNDEDAKEFSNEQRVGIFTKKEGFGVNKIYYTLLENASKLLKIGGRIVFLFHTDSSYDDEYNKFPEHECFEFVHSCINNCTSVSSYFS